MQNKIIRSKSRENKIPLWRIAQTLGVSEATMTRCLRNELPAAELVGPTIYSLVLTVGVQIITIDNGYAILVVKLILNTVAQLDRHIGLVIGEQIGGKILTIVAHPGVPFGSQSLVQGCIINIGGGSALILLTLTGPLFAHSQIQTGLLAEHVDAVMV